MDKPIIYPIDVGGGFPSQSDLPAITEFLKGVLGRSVRPAGLYGPYWIIEHFRNFSYNGKRFFCFWQTAGSSGNGSGTGGSAYNHGDGSWRNLSSAVCAYQEYGGVTVPNTDHNQVYEEEQMWTNWTWHPEEGAGQEEEMPHVNIWWTSVGDPWVSNVAGLDPSREHGFRVEGPFLNYVGLGARPGEGWDDRTTAVRNEMALLQVPEPREAHGITRDWLETKTLLPVRIPRGRRALHVQGNDAQWTLVVGDREDSKVFLDGDRKDVFERSGHLEGSIGLPPGSVVDIDPTKAEYFMDIADSPLPDPSITVDPEVLKDAIIAAMDEVDFDLGTDAEEAIAKAVIKKLGVACENETTP